VAAAENKERTINNKQQQAASAHDQCNEQQIPNRLQLDCKTLMLIYRQAGRQAGSCRFFLLQPALPVLGPTVS
jgi:hypothetical protein